MSLALSVLDLVPVRSDQTSADAHIDGSYSGALTYFLVRAMREAGGVKTRAAELLGYKNYQTLAAQLERLKVELPGS